MAARVEFQSRFELRSILTPDQLKEYAGRYENEELAATHRLAASRRAALAAREQPAVGGVLEATVRDELSEPYAGTIRHAHHDLSAERRAK